MRSFMSWLSRNVTKNRVASPCELRMSHSISLRRWYMPTSASGAACPLTTGRSVLSRGVIERGVDTDLVPPVACVAADEPRNVLRGAAVEHLAEGEEVLLADAQRELPDGVAEGLGEVPLEVARVSMR